MSDSAWYERYFGRDYLRIYRLADTAEQLRFLRGLLRPDDGALLDLPCGHGRHAAALAADGFAVTGLDLSPEFLAVARATARELGVRLDLVRGDMRDFPFADGSFAAAICMFTSLGYFALAADNQRVLDEFGRVVRTGGRFVLDLANIDHVRRQAAESSWAKDGAEVHSIYHWDEASRRAVTRREVEFAEGRREVYESSVRLYEGDEIEAMLGRAGFAVERVYGRYTGEDLAAGQPRRLLICRRKG